MDLCRLRPRERLLEQPGRELHHGQQGADGRPLASRNAVAPSLRNIDVCNSVIVWKRSKAERLLGAQADEPRSPRLAGPGGAVQQHVRDHVRCGAHAIQRLLRPRYALPSRAPPAACSRAFWSVFFRPCCLSLPRSSVLKKELRRSLRNQASAASTASRAPPLTTTTRMLSLSNRSLAASIAETSHDRAHRFTTQSNSDS